VPATCKIRKVSAELQDTLNLCYQLEASGCSAICLHGRTKEQKSQQTGECDWETIGIVKKRLTIPVIANGGVETREEALRCLEVTGADAVMSAEAILENPALFYDGQCAPTWQRLTEEYLDIAAKYPPASRSTIRSHLFRLLHVRLQENPHIRQQLTNATSIDDYRAVVKELSKARKVTDNDSHTMGWYRRHRHLVSQEVKTKRPLPTKQSFREDESALMMDGLFVDAT